MQRSSREEDTHTHTGIKQGRGLLVRDATRCHGSLHGDRWLANYLPITHKHNQERHSSSKDGEQDLFSLGGRGAVGGNRLGAVFFCATTSNYSTHAQLTLNCLLQKKDLRCWCLLLFFSSLPTSHPESKAFLSSYFLRGESV